MITFLTDTNPAVLWGIVATIAIGVATVLGFLVGFLYAKHSAHWNLRRANREFPKLFRVAMQSLQRSQDLCGLLESSENCLLTPTQIEQVDRRQTELLKTMNSIVFRQYAVADALNRPRKSTVALKPMDPINWVSNPVDGKTKLPNRIAFESNLQSLLELMAGTDSESGVLLIKIDKMTQLIARHGQVAGDQFISRASRVICRAIRETDLLCRYSTDTFGLLIPHVSYEDGIQLAESVRNSIRYHKFRLDESGPEVLVTASLGYTSCCAGENVDLAINRAGDALARSQRCGRNQLHINDGSNQVHCLTH